MAAAFGAVVPVATAGASCEAPSMTFDPHDVARGQTIAVVGTGWGDDCHDVGDPPAGEGPLGIPLEGIHVVLVQGNREWDLWSGAAGEDYGFTASVVVPVDAAPGAAQLLARRPDTAVSTFDQTLRISDAAPVTTTSPPTLTPPREPEGSAASPGSEPSSGGVSIGWFVVIVAAGAIVAVAIVAVAIIALRRRRQRDVL
ncbi:MAG TPA: hypothetical protein PKE05_00145 [Microthrixaceae bacterium]|nr:hypothetical protein [Microthrixaceae bacterium]